MKRLGICLGHDLSIKDSVKYVTLAEKRGFDSIWIPEDYYYRDAISRITAIASVTKKIKLATSIINPYSRSPPLIAMTLATIDEFSNKRAVLGLGPSLRLWLYESHRGYIKHLVAMRECIDIFRDMISGKMVSYNGQYFKIKNVRLGFEPVRSHIPVYLGVMGPRMLQLAGEMADGVLLTAGTTTEYVKFAVKNIKKGAERVDRNYKEIDIACLVMLSVAEDPEVAKSAAKHLVAYLIALPQFNPILRASGLQDNDAIMPIREAGLKGDIHGATKYVNDELIEALTISGTPKECKTKLKKFMSAGINLPVILVNGSGEKFDTAIKAVS